MVGFNMPMDKERDGNERKGGGSSISKSIFKPLPDKAGQIGNNDVIIPLFSPNNWSIFNPTPEIARKYGMVGGGGLVSLDANDPLTTFFFRLRVHNVSKFQRPDTSIGFSSVICPIAMNKYLDTLGYGPMFENPRCAFCEEEQRHWDITNARWEEKKLQGTDKDNLTNDGYWETIKNDPILSAERKITDELKVRDRFVVSVFDHAKFTGQRPKDEDEDSVAHQIFFAPNAVYDGLFSLYKAGGEAGFRFFDPTPQGFAIVTVVKNTTKCSVDMRNTQYSVTFLNKYYQYSQEWVDYIMNQSLMVDPSEFVYMVTYEESKMYATQYQSSRNDFQAPSTTPVPGAAPGSVPEGFTAPQTPQVPQAQVPVQAPVFAPPTGAVAPPVAPPTAPVPSVVTPTQAVPPGAPPTRAVPMGAPPAGVPPTAVPLGTPPVPVTPPVAPVPVQAPVAPVQAPVPVVGAAQAQIPDRSLPPGSPPGQRRKW